MVTGFFEGKESEEDIKTRNLELGKKVEAEHQSTYDWLQKVFDDTGKLPAAEELFDHISQDHVNEFPGYYEALEAMEFNLGDDKPEEDE